ncbi:hypothetical protein BGX29_002711 [Mortierella sp. GBA35]|nr:hypothetical protein BGX29_002711 [Mortierella sp. GBA35]
MSDKKDELASSHFLPSSAIGRFMALQTLAKGSQPTSPSSSSSSRPSKKPRNDSTTTVATPVPSPTLSRLPRHHQQQAVSRAGSQTGSSRYATNLARSTSATTRTVTTQNRIPPAVMNEPQTQRISGQAPRPQYIELPTTTPREYDPIPPPSSEETYKYIASTRLLQKTHLVRALLDPDCGRISLVERDFEYLKAITPDTVQCEDTTLLVEADLVVDEQTAIIFYPLGDIGQAAGLDADGGLNTLVATLARIGPRYKVLWLIFEEYYSPAFPMNYTTATAASHFYRAPSSLLSSSTSSRNPAAVSRAPSATSILMRPNPYTGPTLKQLIRLMAWIPFTRTRSSWLFNIHRPGSGGVGGDGGQSHRHQVKESTAQQSFGMSDSARGMDNVPFETQVVFASDERCAARMARAIGEGTHERFLGSFRLFNPFSIQLILSLCSLKEFFAMSHQERCKAVGRFIDPNILAIFDKVITTPTTTTTGTTTAEGAAGAVRWTMP